MQRGDIWWANLPEPVGSGPGFRRPVLVIQADSFIRSRIRTVTVAIITKNITLAKAPGNVLIAAQDSRLPLDSVVNVSQVITLDKSLLTEYISCLSPLIMAKIDDGLRLAISL